MKNKRNQINIPMDDELEGRVVSYANEHGIKKATAARELLIKGLDENSSEPVTVTDTLNVDLARRVEKLESQQEEKSWIRRKLHL